MKGQRIILMTVAASLAVLLVGWLALAYARSREPCYQGQTLTYWLREYDNALSIPPGDTNTPAIQGAAAEAVRAIGTNAIPFLLRKVSAEDNFLQRHLRSLAGSQPWIQFHFDDHRSDRTLGQRGFMILQQDAIDAQPALTKLIGHTNTHIRWAALESFISIHPKPVTLQPILLEDALHDPDIRLRVTSRHHLMDMFPNAAMKAGMWEGAPWPKPED